MNRRGFLRLLGGAAVAAAAPTKAYSFLGGILRPRPTWPAWEMRIPEYMLGPDSWRYAVRITNIDVSKLLAEKYTQLDDLDWRADGNGSVE